MVTLMILIDMHTHILPHIDDGASNLSEAQNMIETLYNQNTITAVCTPHFNPVTTTIEQFAMKRNEASNLIKDSKIKLIQGSETVLHDYLFYYSDLNELCIENTNYILIELPFIKKWPKTIYSLIKRLIMYFDIIPIIAHIERYPPTMKNKKNIQRLRDLGCIIQVNTTTVLNERNNKRVLNYIKENYVDVLGSDCHNMTLRTPILKEAYEKIEKELGEEYCKNLIFNAWCIVKGMDIRNKGLIMSEEKEKFLNEYQKKGSLV